MGPERKSEKGDCREVLRYLFSPDLRTSEQAEQTLKTQLATSGDWYGCVMDEYVMSGSGKLCELLAGVREPQDRAFLDALTDAFRSDDGRLPAIALLSRVVQQQASWIPKLPHHRIFTDLLKMLKSTKKPVEVVAGLFLLAALLPHSRVLNSDLLRELFTVMLKTAFYVYRLNQMSATALRCNQGRTPPHVQLSSQACPNSQSCAVLLLHTYFYREMGRGEQPRRLALDCGHQKDRAAVLIRKFEEDARKSSAVLPLPPEPRLDNLPPYLGLIEVVNETTGLAGQETWEIRRDNHAVVYCFEDDCNGLVDKPGFSWANVTWVQVPSMADGLGNGTICAGPERPSWPARLEGLPAADLSNFSTLLYCPDVQCCGVTVADGKVTDRHCPSLCLTTQTDDPAWNCTDHTCTCHNHRPMNLTHPCNSNSTMPVLEQEKGEVKVEEEEGEKEGEEHEGEEEMMKATAAWGFLLPGSLVSVVVSLLVRAGGRWMQYVLRFLGRVDDEMLDLETLLRRRGLKPSWTVAWCKKRGAGPAELGEVERAVKVAATALHNPNGRDPTNYNFWYWRRPGLEPGGRLVNLTHFFSFAELTGMGLGDEVGLLSDEGRLRSYSTLASLTTGHLLPRERTRAKGRSRIFSSETGGTYPSIYNTLYTRFMTAFTTHKISPENSKLMSNPTPSSVICIQVSDNHDHHTTSSKSQTIDKTQKSK